MNRTSHLRTAFTVVLSLSCVSTSLTRSALAEPVAKVAASAEATPAASAGANVTAEGTPATAASPEAVKDSTSVSAPTAVPTRPGPEQIQAAKAAFGAGDAAIKAGDYALAEQKFREAYAIIPTPHAEYWIAYSMDKQNKPAKEVFFAYDLFLSNPAAAHVGEEELKAAQDRAALLKSTLPATVIVESTPAGAQVKIDGVIVPGVTPLEVEMNKGTHRLELTLAGYDATAVEIDTEAGARVRAPIELQKTTEAPPAAVAAAEPPKKRSKVPGYVTLGLGGAGLITGTIFGILALDSKSKYDANPSAPLADETERNALIADMSFGIALTLGITGVVLLTTDDDGLNPPQTAKAKAPGHVRFSPYGGPLGGGATLSGAF
jgi:hypothetical protein